MKLILFVILVLVKENPIKGNELNHERIEKMFNSMMTEIKDLSGKVTTLENQVSQDQSKIKYLSEKVQTLEHQMNQAHPDQSPKVQDPLEDRVEKLEQLSKYKTLRTCHELASRGVSLSGVYEIDPDGDGIGQPPIQAYCDFTTNTTQIFHDKEELLKIDKCDSVGCAVYDMNYFAPQEQIDALVSLSQSCYQDLNFGCFMAPLEFDGIDQGYWLDRNGDVQVFFDGDHPGQHLCKCAEDQSCDDSELDLTCNCDSKSPTWTFDLGRITAKHLLPVTSFHYGPLKYDLERANLTLGRLVCSGIPIQ